MPTGVCDGKGWGIPLLFTVSFLGCAIGIPVGLTVNAGWEGCCVCCTVLITVVSCEIITGGFLYYLKKR